MLAHQQDVGGVAGGQREGAQVFGLEVVQIRLAGAAGHHRGLGAARLQDIDHGATALPPDRAVPELSTTPAMSGLADPSGSPVVGPFVTPKPKSQGPRDHFGCFPVSVKPRSASMTASI